MFSRTATAVVLLAAMAAAHHDVNVRYRSCARRGGSERRVRPVPNKEQVAGGCRVQRVTRAVAGDWAPYEYVDPTSHELRGFFPEVFAWLCANTEALSGVECVQVREDTAAVWTPRGYPGKALTSGRYDTAAGYSSQLKKTSFTGTRSMAARVPHLLVGLSAAAGGEPLAFNDGDSIAVACPRGDAATVKTHYANADVVCAVDVDDQLAKVASKTAKVAWVTAEQWRDVIQPTLTLSGRADEFETFGAPQPPLATPNEDGTAGFMLAKDNVCARGALETALEEMEESEAGRAFTAGLCGRYPGVCVGEDDEEKGTPSPEVDDTPAPTSATVIGPRVNFRVLSTPVDGDASSRKVCFSAEVDTAKWIALGFSKEGHGMADSDIVWGYVDGAGEGHINVAKGVSKEGRPEPGTLAISADHPDAGVTIENGVTKVCFVRGIDAGTGTVALTSATPVIWAVGPLGADGESLSYHGSDGHDKSGMTQENRSDEAPAMDFLA